MTSPQVPGAPGPFKPLTLGGFAEVFGPVLARRLGPAEWEYALETRAEHLNRAGRVHGGVLLALADQVISLVAWNAAGRVPAVTVQMNASFPNSAREGELLTARSRIDSATRSLMFMSCTISGPRGVVLTASGIWKTVSPAARREDPHEKTEGKP